MAKTNYPEINLKAAAITGGVLGLLCWLLIIPYSSSVYNMMGYIVGYGTGTMSIFHSFSLLSIIIDMALGAVSGALIALIYNWALKLK